MPAEARGSWSRHTTGGGSSTAACRQTRRGDRKELEHENAKLKRLVRELSLEKLVLKDIASGNF
jgi:hypothetical protein